MKKKRVVILTGKAGQGHLSIAGAYQYWLEKWGYQAEIYDVLPSLNSKLLALLYKAPATYKSLFKMSNQPLIAQMMAETIMPEVEKRIASRVPKYATADIIISTYPLIRPPKTRAVRIMLLPDPVAHAAYFTDPEPDYYFAFWEQSLKEAARFVPDMTKVIYTPPLARSSFYEVGRKVASAAFRADLKHKFGIPKDHLLILVVAGGAWIYRAKEYLEPLQKTFGGEKIVFAFVCGKNQKFAERILADYGHEPIFKVLSWLPEKEMAKWMAAADYGLAFSLAQMAVEAGLTSLPIFVFRLIEGQEDGFREIIDNKGVGMNIPGEPEKQVALLKVLLKHAKGIFAKSMSSWQKELLSGPSQVKSIIWHLTKKIT